jgi:hypothetical protein
MAPRRGEGAAAVAARSSSSASMSMRSGMKPPSLPPLWAASPCGRRVSTGMPRPTGLRSHRPATQGGVGSWRLAISISPILAGIVVTAAADVLTISQPTAGTTLTSAAVIIGGPALFLAASASGWALDGKRPTHRLAALCALAALAAAANFASQLSLLIAATAIVLGSPSGTGWR